eukprot:NODE_4828_length_1841_cov_5.312719.p1 GENE.NODE_4828_length_1841_cov_5.312719~~NODE_4828_length_1841_cov_5.312719.p1  ORF type:complete len:471 (+),score=123.39 NODE_4828_length_1841_cov_5.312719:182-1594(+)
MELQIVPHAGKAPPPIVAKPHHGALVTIGQKSHQGAPTTKVAWVADGALVAHMEERNGRMERPRKVRSGYARCAFRVYLVLLWGIEATASLLAYIETKAPADRFYNKFEAHMLGIPYLDLCLLVLVVLDVSFLFVSFAVLVLVRGDLFEALGRMKAMISAPLALLCAILVAFAEQTKLFVFMSSLFAAIYLLLIALEAVLARRNRVHRFVLLLLLVVVLVASLCIGAWAGLYAVDGGVFYLHDDACPASEFSAMPVLIDGVDEWQCAKWGEMVYIDRQPSSQAVTDATCSSAFPAELITGSSANSSAHYVNCPSDCQVDDISGPVYGCNVYDVASAVCTAAVQAGVLMRDQGGVVTVVLTAPQSSWSYARCDQNTVVSSEEPATAPSSVFYFQTPMTADYDVLLLRDWRQTRIPSPSNPWEAYTADVTWTLGGAISTREVVLGPQDDGAEIELNFCHASADDLPDACSAT